MERWLGSKVDRLVARSLKTGDVAWSDEMTVARGPAPVIAGGRVMVHGEHGVVALDVATGQRRWSSPLGRTTPVSQGTTTMAVALGSAVLVVCAGGQVHALSLEDGHEEWAGEAAPGAMSVDSPVIAGGGLYVVADGAVVRLLAGDGP